MTSKLRVKSLEAVFIYNKSIGTGSEMGNVFQYEEHFIIDKNAYKDLGVRFSST